MLMQNMSGKELADRIGKVLQYLKVRKISQSEVEARLNYTSLSKAKNFQKYPQSIIEKKTRLELLLQILSTYNLAYNEDNDTVIESGEFDSIQKENKDCMYYIMYYYAFARETIGKAIIKIHNKKKVYINYPKNENWEGIYEVIENYTFISAEKKGDTTPVRKLICLFSGTEKFGRPILLGSYSTVKRDGYPVAGNLILLKSESEKQLEKMIKKETDPRIAHYLYEKIFVTDTFTPNSLKDLSRDYTLVQKYVASYNLFYKYEHDKLMAELDLNKNGRANITIASVSYHGYFQLLDSQTIKIVLEDSFDFSHHVKEEITIILQTNQSIHLPLYVGSGVTNIFKSNKLNFKCVALNKENNPDMYMDKINQYLD